MTDADPIFAAWALARWPDADLDTLVGRRASETFAAGRAAERERIREIAGRMAMPSYEREVIDMLLSDPVPCTCPVERPLVAHTCLRW